MDILAAMLAYLGCATGIVGALVISFYVYLVAPAELTAPTQTAAVAVKADAFKTGVIKAGAPQSAAVPPLNPVITIARRAEDATPSAPIAADARQKGQSSPARLRRLAQEERARRWVYQQDSSFESRFMSYAD